MLKFKKKLLSLNMALELARFWKINVVSNLHWSFRRMVLIIHKFVKENWYKFFILPIRVITDLFMLWCGEKSCVYIIYLFGSSKKRESKWASRKFPVSVHISLAFNKWFLL